MKYKVEVIINKKIVQEFVFDRLSHPRQAIRKAVSTIKDKLNYYIIYISNEYGEVWSYVVRKDISKKTLVRLMKKYGYVVSKDNVDLIFTGNKTIFEVLQ